MFFRNILLISTDLLYIFTLLEDPYSQPFSYLSAVIPLHSLSASWPSAGDEVGRTGDSKWLVVLEGYYTLRVAYIHDDVGIPITRRMTTVWNL